MRKSVLLTLFVLVSLVGTLIASPLIVQFLLAAGIVPEEITVAGTGSMYPTFPKGTGDSDVMRASETVAWPKMRRYPSTVSLAGFHFFTYSIGYGDIIEFDNEKTKSISKEKYGKEAGFIKRIIGVPGDTIELRDGFVLRNGTVLTEPYTATPRSTYGGSLLPDCQALRVPEESVFVLGDNRKASFDSRFSLGVVSVSDIHYVLPWSEQKEYRPLWRDTTNDTVLAHTATLDPVAFVSLLNEKREEKKLKPYAYEPSLSDSAKNRGARMIVDDDFTIEASKSGYTMKKAIQEAGYRNIVFAEVFTRGFYEAQELLDNFLEFPDTTKILFSKEYQDIGVNVAIGDVKNCPTQVVVVHLGGYVPPNYTVKERESWEKLVNVLNDVIPSWEAVRNNEGINATKLEMLLSLLHTRRDHAQTIVSRMQKNQWLTDAEQLYVSQDRQLNDDAEKIVEELNTH